MTTAGDCLTSDLHEVFQGYGAQASSYVVEVRMTDRYGHSFWTTVIVAHEPTVYRTLERARKIKSYLRAFDRRTFTKIRETRIVKITVSREII